MRIRVKYITIAFTTIHCNHNKIKLKKVFFSIFLHRNISEIKIGILYFFVLLFLDSISSWNESDSKHKIDNRRRGDIKFYILKIK